jgi:hypothetical protein
MSDAHLIGGIVGFERVTSWARARQARLLAEFTRRRPTDAGPNVDRASVASPYAPDEVGIALQLARGTAAARLNTARQLLDVLPATHGPVGSRPDRHRQGPRRPRRHHRALPGAGRRGPGPGTAPRPPAKASPSSARR